MLLQAGNELLATDQNQQPIIPTDRWGESILPSTTAPPSTDYPTSLGDGSVNPDGVTDGASSKAEDASADSSTGIIVAIIAIALILIVGYVASVLRKAHSWRCCFGVFCAAQSTV